MVIGKIRDGEGKLPNHLPKEASKKEKGGKRICVSAFREVRVIGFEAQQVLVCEYERRR